MKSLAAVLAAAVLACGAGAAMAASQEATDTAMHNNTFGTDLYAQLDKSNAGKNLFFSPYSISSALGMTAQGARGRTAEQMNKVLHAGDKFPAGMAEITAALNPTEKVPFDLAVSNNLWVEQTFPLAGGFVADAKKNYRAGVVGLDFLHSAEPARKQINTAIAAQTRDKIKDLLPAGSVDASTALVLTNAIYFKGAWQTPFNKAQTMDQPFHVTAGKDVTVPLMKSPTEAMFGYGEGDDYQVVSLAYQTQEAPAGAARGGRGAAPASTLSMAVILPKKLDGLADLEKQATAENLSKWTSGLRRSPVQVFMPRFTMTTEFELSRELQAMGMKDAFTGAADFSGISASAGNKLAISAVIHKAFVDVNEEGTEAAAATGVIMTRSAIMTNRAEFRADHPFLFLIRHEPTGQILFIGRVVEPKG